MFKSLFAHDRSRGQVYTLRERDGKGQPVTITQLGIRLHECGAEWQEQRRLLSALLEVLEDEMPVLPPAHATAPERGTVSSLPPTRPPCAVGHARGRDAGAAAGACSCAREESSELTGAPLVRQDLREPSAVSGLQIKQAELGKA